MQIQYTNRSICFPGHIYCDRTWLLFLGVQIRLLTRCKICFTLGLSNYFSLKSLSLCLKSHMNVPWSVDYKLIVWFKLWIYWRGLRFRPWLNLYINSRITRKKNKLSVCFLFHSQKLPLQPRYKAILHISDLSARPFQSLSGATYSLQYSLIKKALKKGTF